MSIFNVCENCGKEPSRDCSCPSREGLRTKIASLNAECDALRAELDRIRLICIETAHTTKEECEGCGCIGVGAEEAVGVTVDRLRAKLAEFTREPCYRLKPLQWEGVEPSLDVAEPTSRFQYAIGTDSGVSVLMVRYAELVETKRMAIAEGTLEAAKLAAEEHWQTRAKSALVEVVVP